MRRIDDDFDVGEQMFLASTMGRARPMTRVVEPRTECNCHGWIFASGQFGVYGSQVSAILEDNGYGVVQDPRDGDIAIYWQRGMPVHSGMVRISRSSPGRLIESKWGPFGVYLHQQEAHPFAGDCSYYRSARRACERDRMRLTSAALVRRAPRLIIPVCV